MAGDSTDITSRLDTWIAVGVGAFLSVASFILAAVWRQWLFLLVGLAFAAFIPSRYFSPTPLFRPFGRASLVAQVNASLSMPRWVNVCDWVGIGLFVSYLVLKWVA